MSEVEEYLAVKGGLVHHDPSGTSVETPLELRKCSAVALDGHFYEPKDDKWNREKLRSIRENTLCLADPSLVKFKGGFDLTHGLGLNITFGYRSDCVDKPFEHSCKTYEQISEWVRQVTVNQIHNTASYRADRYED